MGFTNFCCFATSLHPPAFSEAALSLMQEVAEKVNRVMHAGYVKARPVMVLAVTETEGEDFHPF